MTRWFLAATLLMGCGSGGSDPQGTGGMQVQPGTGGTTGSGGATPQPERISVSTVVQLKTTTWTCYGPMNLVVQVPPGDVVSGSWTCAEMPYDCTYRQIYVLNTPCIRMGGPVMGNFAPDATVTLSLTTEPGFALPVTGTYGPSGIVGTAQFSDGQGQFIAP